MFFVYIIKSIQEDWYYVGLSKNILRRLKEHNDGKVRSTRSRRPYKLIYKETFKTRLEARIREKQLKNGHRKKRLIEKIKDGGCSSIG
jgi:putative endonuclease